MADEQYLIKIANRHSRESGEVIVERSVHYIIHDFLQKTLRYAQKLFRVYNLTKVYPAPVMNNADNMVLSVNYRAEKAADYQQQLFRGKKKKN